MIKAEKIQLTTLPHFAPDGTFLGELTSDESLQVRCQIAEQEAEGYYLVVGQGTEKEEKVDISKDGRVDNNRIPYPIYCESLILLARLFKAQRAKTTGKVS